MAQLPLPNTNLPQGYQFMDKSLNRFFAFPKETILATEDLRVLRSIISERSRKSVALKRRSKNTRWRTEPHHPDEAPLSLGQDAHRH